MGKQWKHWQTLVSWAPNNCRWRLQPWNSKTLASWKKNEEQPRQHIKKQKHHFDYKSPSNQSTGFSSSLVWMWEFDHKESWVPKNWCFSTVLLEKTLESPLDCKEIKSILQEIFPEYSLDVLLLKLKFQYFGHLIQRTDSLEKTLMLGRLKEGGKGDDRRWDGWMASPTQRTWD